MDSVKMEARSRNMASIKNKNTKPEIVIRKLLHKHGFRFRIHDSKLPGRPDIVLAKYRVCILVNGCFWHRHLNCKYATSPKTRVEFWENKFRNNVIRDNINKQLLVDKGWKLIELWTCGITNNESELLWILHEIITPGRNLISWPEIEPINQTNNHSLE
ncbi:very short patch repair endonuclease [Pseudomonas sp. NPDC089401]|uniref:very short patch repair endonuclease n=1 Tax=Pseudomonas sp. NPDC089401 TaxID=3364462 RepID=UPI00382037A7